MNKHNTREIDKILYALKRQYGFSVDFYKIVSTSVYVQTGKQVETRRKITIPRVIVLPADMLRKFVYDLSFIATNKQFTIGGFFDRSLRHLIIHQKDIPADFNFVHDDYFIYQGRRWNITGIEDFELATGKIIQGTEAKAQPLGQSFAKTVTTTVAFTQSAVNVD